MIFLLAAIACSAGLTLILKAVSSSQGSRYVILLGNYTACVICALVNAQNPAAGADYAAWGIGLIGGVLFLASLAVMQASIQRNGAAMTSAFGKLGMTVNLALSFFFFREEPRLIQLAGVLLVIPAVILITRPSDEGTAGRSLVLPLLSGTLLLSGLAEGAAKFFEHYGNPGQSGSFFLILFSTAGLLTACLLVYDWKANGAKIIAREYLLGMLAGIPNYFASFFLLRALMVLPSYIVYPAVGSGTIPAVALVSAAVFHERLAKREIAGICLILLALVLMNL